MVLALPLPLASPLAAWLLGGAPVTGFIGCVWNHCMLGAELFLMGLIDT